MPPWVFDLSNGDGEDRKGRFYMKFCFAHVKFEMPVGHLSQYTSMYKAQGLPGELLHSIQKTLVISLERISPGYCSGSVIKCEHTRRPRGHY